MSAKPTYLRHLTLNVEGMAGSHIDDIFANMIALSNQLSIMVTCNVNGADIIAIVGNDVADLISQYDTQIRRKR